MIDLASILDEHGGEVYADFQSEYGVDLAAAIREGSRSPGAIVELVWQLPDGSRFARALGGDRASWGADRLLLMDVANQARILNYFFLQANGGKNVKKPDLHESPHQRRVREEEESAHTMTPETIAEMERRKARKRAAEADV